MKKVVLLILILGIVLPKTKATEGMWLPLLLADLNEAEMQSLGMKMTAEDIYSVNKGSLKDAIVHFGGFCTAEVISKNGLLLTNHHCGFGQIQSHSTLEHNYLEDGFWAKNHSEELANPGLFATFIVRIEDVTKQALAGVSDDMSKEERQALIDKNLDKVKKKSKREEYQDVMVKPFYAGNQYFLFVTETYNDVRLVGTPPSSIGKYGADTDNWVWPRHTGDFSIFRIYAGKDNKPADYSPDNVPYQPRHSLPISIDGVEEDDFTLVFGFPGRTNEYLPAAAVDQRMNELNPIRISVRDKSLSVIGNEMKSNPEARIQYAAKQARIANGWKKWIGESLGINKTGGIEKKLKWEEEFTQRVGNNKEWQKKYGDLLPTMNKLYAELEPYAKSRDYYNEIVRRNIELFYIVSLYDRYAKMATSDKATFEQRLPRLVSYLEDYYKDFDANVDQRIFEQLIPMYLNEMNPKHQAQYVKDQLEFAKGDMATLAKTIYTQSVFSKGSEVVSNMGDNPDKFFSRLDGDYALQMYREMKKVADEKIFKRYNEINSQIEDLQGKYMEALMTVFPERRFYPDANSTMRVTYGQVKGFSPQDAVEYKHQTWLSGLMAKYKPGDYEFDVPAKLIELYDSKDYGQYGVDGKMPVCFIGSNHTTGGNSGSPAIDAHGNLIGLNFDRAWEGTMSDYNYDPSICRNIMVDARYILFIVDKFAGATHLIDEMELVHPKK